MFRYYPSLESLLRGLYPNHQWETWQFIEAEQTPRGFWRSKANLFKAIDWAEKKMGITKVKACDYYFVVKLFLFCYF